MRVSSSHGSNKLSNSHRHPTREDEVEVVGRVTLFIHHGASADATHHLRARDPIRVHSVSLPSVVHMRWSIGPFIGPFIGLFIGPFIGPFIIGPLVHSIQWYIHWTIHWSIHYWSIGPIAAPQLSRRRRRLHSSPVFFFFLFYLFQRRLSPQR